MIFERHHVEKLLLEWRQTQDRDTLTEIMEGCTKLIEAIVSKYDSLHRQDLIQEAYLRVQYALPQFNPAIGNLHTYLTTVIHNTCRTYMTKTSRIPIVDVAGDLEDSEDFDYVLGLIGDGDVSQDDIIYKEILAQTIEYMRLRYPSIPVDDIDYMCQHIVWSLFNNANTQRSVISKISSRVRCLDKRQITIFYTSVLICIRVIMMETITTHDEDLDEFSILRDLCDVIGEEAYNKLSLIFRGISIKFPK